MSSSSTMDLAVVLPCLNEGANLRLLLPRIQTVLADLAASSHIYVIDGGSSDDTVTTAEAFGATVIIQRGKGYGGAIRTAFEDIQATWLLTMDADFSHHPVCIKYLFSRRYDAEVVIASRHVYQGYGDMPLSRRILSGSLNRVFAKVLSMKVGDLSSGFRLYHRNAIAGLELTYETYAVLQEILVQAYCEGFRVAEEPFHYLPRLHGASHARVFQFGVVYMKALRALWKRRNSSDSADYETRAFYSLIPLQRWWQRRRYRLLRDLVGDRMQMLDVGCGSSQILNCMPQMVGIDCRHSKLRFMRRTARNLANADAAALPFRDNFFETILLSQVLMYVEDPAEVIRELFRCLKPGGELIVGVPDSGKWQWRLLGSIYGLLHPDGRKGKRFTGEELKRLLGQNGFHIEESRYILGAELILLARKSA
ncbi:MAG TPA: bifunctional glycosyltransferase/class I SAM-dependent methyltransferase [Candidatus Hydrogenedentes bacterium]|nr:bifunctional glycosyltransferase/class I SAM-dependent methyltransferase [Candidatus Hydrogenedentota bacterium]